MLNLTKPIYPLFFSLLKSNPEGAHLQLLKILSNLDNYRDTAWGKLAIRELEESFCYANERLKQTLWGLNFGHPVGLAPGFDKDGIAAKMWANFGFSFAELGAVTLHAQTGNPRPRMFRLPLDNAALNRMGANNLGAAVMAQTLQEKAPFSIPMGINLCKSKITPLEDAPNDYLGSFNYLKNCADYFVVNVSSPNTPGLRSLQSGEQLSEILTVLQGENQGKKPLFVKIAPDLSYDDILTILELVKVHDLSGIIATNTTISRENLKTEILVETGKHIRDEAGGISGKPLTKRSTEIIRFIYQESRGEIPIIGVGGIFNGEDAWEKITAGASLLQVYTGWIYEGPWLIREIGEYLWLKLQENGLNHIHEAIGVNS
jgi:dihydroorotate dehydrogenase